MSEPLSGGFVDTGITRSFDLGASVQALVMDRANHTLDLQPVNESFPFRLEMRNRINGSCETSPGVEGRHLEWEVWLTSPDGQEEQVETYVTGGSGSGCEALDSGTSTTAARSPTQSSPASASA